jgi:hypothetical protein
MRAVDRVRTWALVEQRLARWPGRESSDHAERGLMPPVTRALRFASAVARPLTVSSVFEPLIADWQRQWNRQPAIAPAGRLDQRRMGVDGFELVAATPKALLAPWPAPACYAAS